jgi:hypothetical protein
MIQEFVGEPDPMSDSTAAEGVGYDSIEFDIVSGQLSVVVPNGTPDDSIWEHPRVCLLSVTTDDGQTFQFEINADGSGSVVV